MPRSCNLSAEPQLPACRNWTIVWRTVTGVMKTMRILQAFH
ncbi:unnamed protein product [Ixodes persulcatus]